MSITARKLAHAENVRRLEQGSAAVCKLRGISRCARCSRYAGPTLSCRHCAGVNRSLRYGRRPDEMVRAARRQVKLERVVRKINREAARPGTDEQKKGRISTLLSRMFRGSKRGA